MYYADLSRYSYSLFIRMRYFGRKLRNVGWLDHAHSIPQAIPDGELVRALAVLARSPVHRTRGWHQCPFCSEYPVNNPLPGGDLHLGSCEIVVKGKHRTIYVCPNLILHYVAIHHYDPPAEFKRAALKEAQRPTG